MRPTYHKRNLYNYTINEKYYYYVWLLKNNDIMYSVDKTQNYDKNLSSMKIAL